MTTQALIRVVLRWWWLFVLGIGLGLFGSYAAQVATGTLAAGSLETYAATATVSLGTEVQGMDQSNTDLNLAESLVPTYVQLSLRPPITTRVIEELNLPFSPKVLTETYLEVVQPEKTQLIEITGKYPEAAMAAAIANETALQLQAAAPIRPTRLVQIVSLAEVPTAPSSSPLLLVIIGGVAGFVLATGLVLLIEFSLDRPYTPEWAEARLTMPILGTYKQKDAPGRPSRFNLFNRDEDKTPNEAVWWTVMSTLENATGDEPLDRARTIVVTSPHSSNSKSAAAVSLAYAAAARGLRTILVDADMRHSPLTHWFKVDAQRGVTTLAMNGYHGNDAKKLLVPGDVEGLSFLPLGPQVNGRSRMTQEAFWRDLLTDLGSEADLIVLNAPSAKLAPEIMPLISQVDGVIETVDLGKTRAPEVRQMQDIFDRVGARVLGVVLNEG